MILRPQSPVRHNGTPANTPAAAPIAAIPSWLRRAIPDAQSLAGKDVEDIAVAAGAAIGALDAMVRRRERWAGAWRQRLALSAAAVTAKQAGRVEDDAALRDAVLLTRTGDFLSVGPAGRMFLGWRRLAGTPAGELLTERSLAPVLEEFGYAPDDEVLSDLANDLRRLGAVGEIVGMVIGAFMAAERHGFGHSFGCWLADLLLALRLGWTHAVPLLGTEPTLSAGLGRSRRSAIASPGAGVEAGSDRAKNLLAVQARATLRAIDLSSELGRRADRLLTVAPKLRAKGADTVVSHLLNEDALVASRGEQKTQKYGMSDRNLRRLFDRLQKLGAVRELSGRPTFRIYGL